MTARPSLRFMWSLDAATRRRSLTDDPGGDHDRRTDDGDFVVWVDPYVGDIWGYYDLAFEPPTTSERAALDQAESRSRAIASQTTLSLDKRDDPRRGVRPRPASSTPSGAAAVGRRSCRVFELADRSRRCAARSPTLRRLHDPGRSSVGHGTSDDTGHRARSRLAREPVKSTLTDRRRARLGSARTQGQLMIKVSTKIRACERDDVPRELCLGSATPGRNQRRRLVPANPGSATRPALRLDESRRHHTTKVLNDDEWNDAHRERCGGRGDDRRDDERDPIHH